MLFFKQLAANTLYVMFGLLLAGIIFYLLKKERLMMVSFICCAALCLHLKSSANNQMRLAAVTSSPSLSISHINLANAETNYDSVINYIRSLDADLISFQELTPDWTAQLTEKLSGEFQYIHTMTRLDQYGMGFFSKVPLHEIDTIFYNDIPSLTCSIEMADNTTANILSCQMIPPVNQNAFIKIDKHFSFLAEQMKAKPGATIVLGDLHLPPWASEIQKFRSISKLQDSRRDINPRNIDGSVSLPRIPVEHIFYCDKFECTSFSELGNEAVGRVGITGTYQLHEDFAVMAN
jgi:endonuclease/exonuclease/phosphatase (EEP) superfamily protein YafD